MSDMTAYTIAALYFSSKALPYQAAGCILMSAAHLALKILSNQ